MCVGNANIDVAASAQPEAPPPPPLPVIDTDLHSATNNTSDAMIPGDVVDPHSAVVDQASSPCPADAPAASSGPSQPDLVVSKEAVQPEFVAPKNASVPSIIGLPSIIGHGTTLTPPKFATVDEFDQVARLDPTAPCNPSTPPPPPERSDSFNESLHTANDTFGDTTLIEADIDDTSKDQTAPELTAAYPDPPPNYALIGAEALPPPPSAPDANVAQDVFTTGQPPMATSSPVPIVRYVRALDTLFEELRIG